MPLIFKMSRQSIMDEVHWALGYSRSASTSSTSGTGSLEQAAAEQSRTWLKNHPTTVKERYFVDWDAAAAYGTTKPLAPCHKQDITKMQLQKDNLRSIIALIYVADSKDKMLPEPSFYTYDCERLLFSWQAQLSMDVVLIPFTPLSGSDERQYCFSLINLPIISDIRTMYGNNNYPFYHTCSDNQDDFALDSIPDSALKLFDLIELYERCRESVITTNIGEPQLGKYKLYPEVNSYRSNMTRTSTCHSFALRVSLLTDILKILSFADGSPNLIELIRIMNLLPYELMDLQRTLESKGLLSRTEQSSLEGL